MAARPDVSVAFLGRAALEGAVMHIQTHLMASWAVGAGLSTRRDRRLVAWAGVLPDLDGVGLFFGPERYLQWHHVLTHNLLAAAVTALVVMAVAQKRVATALLAFLAFHLHFVLDLTGSGPGWSIAYLYPFSALRVDVSWAWDLASWQNLGATMLFLLFSLVFAVRQRRSFVESWAPASIDRTFCDLVVRWWGKQRGRNARGETVP